MMYVIKYVIDKFLAISICYEAFRFFVARDILCNGTGKRDIASCVLSIGIFCLRKVLLFKITLKVIGNNIGINKVCIHMNSMFTKLFKR